ncbi:MAG: RluA family pseudouridine synthase [Cyclobacteriaceae bacterium]
MPQEPQVIYEDNHLLIMYKPAGWLVQGDRTGDKTLADWGKDYLKKKYDKPGNVFLGVVHRLDRPVSGVVAMARTSKALARMNQIFKTRQVTKTYWALVQNPPPQPEATLVHWLIKDSAKNKATAFRTEKKNSKQAELSYRIVASRNPPASLFHSGLLEKGEGIYLLEVKPLTGRPHQIRVQLATIGCSIAGDLKYGATEPLSDACIGLHARQLSFEHPVKREPVTFRANIPGLEIWQPFGT